MQTPTEPTFDIPPAPQPENIGPNPAPVEPDAPRGVISSIGETRDPRTDPQAGDVIREGADWYAVLCRMPASLGGDVRWIDNDGAIDSCDIEKWRRTSWDSKVVAVDGFRVRGDAFPAHALGAARAATGGA